MKSSSFVSATHLPRSEVRDSERKIRVYGLEQVCCHPFVSAFTRCPMWSQVLVILEVRAAGSERPASLRVLNWESAGCGDGTDGRRPNR
jgi:hypothetical protein